MRAQQIELGGAHVLARNLYVLAVLQRKLNRFAQGERMLLRHVHADAPKFRKRRWLRLIVRRNLRHCERQLAGRCRRHAFTTGGRRPLRRRNL